MGEIGEIVSTFSNISLYLDEDSKNQMLPKVHFFRTGYQGFIHNSRIFMVGSSHDRIFIGDGRRGAYLEHIRRTVLDNLQISDW